MQKYVLYFSTLILGLFASLPSNQETVAFANIPNSINPQTIAIGIAVKTTEKLGNVVAGFLYLIIGVLVLMAVLSQQWLEFGVFCWMAVVVFAIQLGAATVEALIEVGKILCRTKI